MKPLRRFEFSGFAVVNEIGYRSVGNKPGAVAGLSGVVVHAPDMRVATSRECAEAPEFFWFDII